MDNQSYEQEIDLKGLIFAVFYKWRGIILTALILGILLGGYKLVSGLDSKVDAESIQRAQERYDESLELYSRNLKVYDTEIQILDSNIKMQQEYFSNSILMKISPYHKNIASADIFVKVNDQTVTGDNLVLTYDPADMMLRGYEALINSETFEDVAGFSAEGRYLKELISTTVDYEGNVLHVQTSYTDAQGAKALLDVVLECVSQRSSEMLDNFGYHECMIMNEKTEVVTDAKLSDTQQMVFDTLAMLEKSNADKKKEFDGLLKPSLPSELYVASNIKGSIKYGALGGILGVFLSVFYSCIVFLLSDKINSEKELKNRYGLKILGVFTQTPKKRAFSGIDRWLERMEGKAFSKSADVYSIIAANVRNYMKEDQNVMILGSASKEKTDEIAAELEKRMSGVDFQVGNDMGMSAETLMLLSNSQQIILVEERGVSKHDLVRNQIEVIRSLDKFIIGFIVL